MATTSTKAGSAGRGATISSAEATAPSETRPLRADAQRNREAIALAARRAFARDGVATSIDDIARDAGVGSATLYRHFPTRDDLLAAALAENMAATHREGARLLTAEHPLPALRDWLLAVINQVSTYGGLPASVLDAAGREGSALGVSCADMQHITRALLDRAQAAGDVAADVTMTELFDLASAIAWIVSRDHPRDRGARLLDLTLNGVRNRATHPRRNRHE